MAITRMGRGLSKVYSSHFLDRVPSLIFVRAGFGEGGTQLAN